MAVPIIWTVISIVVIILTVQNQLFNFYGIALMVFAVACAVFQWMVYFKKQSSGK